MNKISELSQIIKSGARTNKYRVLFAEKYGNGKALDVLCSEVSSPGKSLGTVELYLRGRKYNIAGDRSDDGSTDITFYNDSGLELRNTFLEIIENVQNYDTPIYFGGNTGFSEIIPEYQSDVIIEQLNGKGEIVSKIKLMDAWVQNVSDIQYTDESGDVSKTTVTLNYSGIKVL